MRGVDPNAALAAQEIYDQSVSAHVRFATRKRGRKTRAPTEADALFA